MAWLTTWLLLSCAGDDTKPPIVPDRGPCALDTTQFATATATRTFHPSCGELLLDRFDLDADGTLRFELFTDGVRIVPALTADADATFRAMHLDGTWSLVGAGPVRGIELGAVAGQGAGVVDLPSASTWAGLVGRPGGPAALVGAHSGAQTTFSVEMDGDGAVRATWGGTEPIEVRAGFTLYLDPLFMAVGPDVDTVMGAWMDAVAESAGVVPMVAPAGAGWWPPATDPLALSGAAAAAASVGGEISIDRIGVGPGWDATWDLAAVAGDITSAGHLAGLSLDPFRVAHADPAYAANPDWWVLDEAGDELDDDGHAILDVTQPDAATWLVDRVAAHVAEGFQWLDLARVDAGGLTGQRRTPVPGVVALRQGLDLIRQGAGADVVLLARDAPALPVVGKVDVVAGGPSWGAASGRLWLGADAPLEVAGLDDEAARGAVVRAAVAAGSWDLGDALLAPATVELVLASAPFMGLGAPSAPVDPLVRVGVPAGWTLGTGATALVNASADEIEVDGPGGTEILTGESASAGPRSLAPWAGELWQ